MAMRKMAVSSLTFSVGRNFPRPAIAQKKRAGRFILMLPEGLDEVLRSGQPRIQKLPAAKIKAIQY